MVTTTYVKLGKAKNSGRCQRYDQNMIIYHKSKTVLKFGKETNPKIALFVMGSKDIETMYLLELGRDK
ncbi:MAG: hypothetical protein OEM28_11105 [Nitrosopumilus sp.]|nr:hypothetical protein [Nitrosopumilus sp.]MDH3488553.1 hypothetical protein [Nitrosopumilus sp.]